MVRLCLFLKYQTGSFSSKLLYTLLTIPRKLHHNRGMLQQNKPLKVSLGIFLGITLKIALMSNAAFMLRIHHHSTNIPSTNHILRYSNSKLLIIKLHILELSDSMPNDNIHLQPCDYYNHNDSTSLFSASHILYYSNSKLLSFKLRACDKYYNSELHFNKLPSHVPNGFYLRHIYIYVDEYI